MKILSLRLKNLNSFVWRCITKLRVSLTFHNRKMIS